MLLFGNMNQFTSASIEIAPEGSTPQG